MVNPNFPIPFKSVTGAGVGVYPLPVDYGDDGYTAVTVKITSAAAGDLTVFTMSGTAAVTTPVPVVAGDPAQTALDIANAAVTGFTGIANGSMVSISREYSDLQPQYPYPPNFSVVTTTGATTKTVVNTRLVIEEEGGGIDGTYLLLDAARPFDQSLPPGPQPDAGYVSRQTPVSIAEKMYVWIPELSTMHQITKMKAGGYGEGPEYKDVAYHITLDPVPATSAGELYAVLPFLPMRRRCTVRNVGGAAATLDGQAFAAGSYVEFEAREKPFVYNPLTSTLEFVFDGL